MELLEHINELAELVVDLRREFHQIPEVAFAEFQTAERIAKYLTSWGVKVETNVGKTGVVGLVQGEIPGKTIAIRSDMDGLPIQEETNLEFSSRHPGKMHACGHDSHIAIGLAVAKLLADNRQSLKGNVKLIFQPSEEQLGGAKAMIADGVLENPSVDAFIALHNWPELPTGKLGVTAGSVTGGVDRFSIVVKGQGGHGALPHQAKDPVVMSSQIVLSLQNLVSRMNSPTEPLVVTIGTINGGDAFNIIPDKVTLTGTVRTSSVDTQAQIPTQMEAHVKGITQMYGSDYDLEYIKGIPPVVNPEDFTAFAHSVLTKHFGSDRITNVKPSMIGEDVSLFLEQVPGMLLFLGTGFPANQGYRLHHPKYQVDEKSLIHGVKALACLAYDFLHQAN